MLCAGAKQTSKGLVFGAVFGAWYGAKQTNKDKMAWFGAKQG